MPQFFAESLRTRRCGYASPGGPDSMTMVSARFRSRRCRLVAPEKNDFAVETSSSVTGTGTTGSSGCTQGNRVLEAAGEGPSKRMGFSAIPVSDEAKDCGFNGGYVIEGAMANDATLEN